MKRIQSKSNQTTPKLPISGEYRLLRRMPIETSEFDSGHGIVSACLQCIEQPCINFVGNEKGAYTPVQPCPVNAISLNLSNTSLSISESCFGCGLCAVRCPYGSIIIENGSPKLTEADCTSYANVTESEFRTFEENLVVSERPTEDAARHALEQFMLTIRSTKQTEFYGLVTSLFTCLGLPASQTPSGDTNNRIDVLVHDHVRSIPIEAKSPTETVEINIKSVQQALENKIILTARRSDDHPTTKDTTTLVVGYGYPPPRSGVEQMVEDIRASYDVKIGLVTVREIYWLIIKRDILAMDIESDIARMSSLVGKF